MLLQADDPHKALFVDFPAIFGDSDAEAAAAGIEAAMLELGEAYLSILRDLSRKMLRALGLTEGEDLPIFVGGLERSRTSPATCGSMLSPLASLHLPARQQIWNRSPA